jgi:alpha-ketoglutarate-dependent taurine dioxygenase
VETDLSAVSERGVVFFRAQDNLTDQLQKKLVHRLGQLTNKPSDSTLHIHPVLNNTSEFGVDDAEISTISSLARKQIFRHEQNGRQTGNRRYDAAQWHSDIQFEPVPADYTSLRLTQLPETGGDTLWASGYEIYDRFSKAYQKFFEGLTATFVGDGFIRAAEADPERVKLYEKERGSPKNVGKELKAVHPVVRTNPVTGWKSIFALGPFPKYINELNDEESSELLKKFRSAITENHDLQVRLKWRNKNDLGKPHRCFGTSCRGLTFVQLFGTIVAHSIAPRSIMMVLVSGLAIVQSASEKHRISTRTVTPEPRRWRRRKCSLIEARAMVLRSPRLSRLEGRRYGAYSRRDLDHSICALINGGARLQYS